ncbi:MAG: glycoside hydrolase family 43 protein [Clostridia bacterium]|nr:glycoside hydrolase family 43 protein [Clostridia bacterium]
MKNYLFCYFTGNDPEQERVHFAVSEDGYNFRALNGNREVITQTLGKKCCRDPFIFRDNEGIFHIIATDMKSDEGWANNNSMVVWDSDDLTEWKNERIIDFTQFSSTRDAVRVWAPEVIFDKTRGEYMIYWTHLNRDSNLDTIPWYAYTKDFSSLTTEPQILYKPKSGLCAIDGDMLEKDGRYYLFVADGEKDGICCVVSDTTSGPFEEPEDRKISLADTALEGNCMYFNEEAGKFILIADQFKSGGYFMQESEDLVHFTPVDKNLYSLDHLKPRHGSMLSISDEEYKRLVDFYGFE